MRICIVVDSHPFVRMGGAEYQAHLLACELARRPGVEVYYLGRRMPLASSGAALPYRAVQIGSVSGFRRRSVAFASVGLWRALDEIRPDAIYQRMRNFYTAACAHYSRRRGVPFFFHVAHEHDLDASVLSGRRMSVKLPFELLDATAGYWGLRRSPNVFVQTRRQEQLLSTRFDRRPLAVVGNFQELPAWLPEKDDNSTRVLWTANFKAFKRPEIYVEIAAAFIDRPEIDFVMVGKPHGHRRFQPLMQRIRSLPNLNFLGAMPFEETNREFSRSHIFVNTSEREGFPNTFIQAWSRGAVVVSLDVDVDDGMESLGIGYCTHSVERLVATIDMLVRDRVKRSDVAARAFAHVNQYHSMSSAVDLADRMLRAAQEHRSAVI